MKRQITYSKLSQGLAKFLSMKKSKHFQQKDLTFNQDERKRYFRLFEKSQATVHELDFIHITMG